MRAIAERIEYTPTAIYHHFRNKEALLRDLSIIDFRSLAAAFLRIGRIEDPLERLVRVGEAYVRFALEHPMQYQLMFMTPHPQVLEEAEIGHGDPSDDAYAFLRQTCQAVIASGRLSAEFKDADQLAQIAWASLHGLMALHIVHRDHSGIDWRDPRETATKMSKTLIRGMLSPERP
jgi:AcrR family transcriptional regulator